MRCLENGSCTGKAFMARLTFTPPRALAPPLLQMRGGLLKGKLLHFPTRIHWWPANRHAKSRRKQKPTPQAPPELSSCQGACRIQNADLTRGYHDPRPPLMRPSHGENGFVAGSRFLQKPVGCSKRGVILVSCLNGKTIISIGRVDQYSEEGALYSLSYLLVEVDGHLQSISPTRVEEVHGGNASRL
ncbi:hypothetical protein BO99DRAFT_229284 [Aspergillus violaceofuscus CBS 115571]|uniref:Uncharacterized protein n=1 Tax=Aspergillus violaceofuscus (strain CBS 115571) TaxID=1450538 RepID=A0A2V5GXE0_ASPV1|nr:hypothetical protein BO99DRAFT_229284 [Aspergillus violaceofuscus CBS 115571]